MPVGWKMFRVARNLLEVKHDARFDRVYES